MPELVDDQAQQASAAAFAYGPHHAAPLCLPRSSMASVRLTRRDVILLAVLGALFLLGYVFAFPRPLSGRPIFSSPRQNVGYVLDERFVGGGGLAYPERYYDRLPPDIGIALTPRDAASL